MNEEQQSAPDTGRARPVRRWRATAAVALAGLIIGGGGGVALGSLSASADDGGPGGRGGPGGFGGPGGRGGAPFQQGGQPGQPGQQGGQGFAPPTGSGTPPSTAPRDDDDTTPDAGGSAPSGDTHT